MLREIIAYTPVLNAVDGPARLNLVFVQCIFLMMSAQSKVFK